MGSIIVFILIPIICAVICYSVAKKRNAAVPFWVVMGGDIWSFGFAVCIYGKAKKINYVEMIVELPCLAA
ncbi:hypothetical protein [Cellvibrio sp. pealriver]|uniref:hypothetical protein n=1 Tax=Cellvibrio sp. pealriver TaxID=1622269 RepID=UPI00066FE227|nr:hypothetical protein [Cellvibrio sp. pealriver]